MTTTNTGITPDIISGGDVASEAARMQSVISSTDVPTFEDPPSPVTKLTTGIVADGIVYDTAVVREVTGEDEEALSVEERRDGGDGYALLLERAVVELRNHDGVPVPKLDLKELTLGDRDILFLAIVAATYGNERSIGAVCPHCGEKLDVGLALDEEFETVPVPESAQSDGTVLLKLRDERTARVRFPTGHMQDRAWEATADKENAAQFNTSLLVECVVDVDGVAIPQAAKRQWALNLGLADRRTLFDFIESKRPGPRIATVQTNCGVCEEPFGIRLDWGRLLYG